MRRITRSVLVLSFLATSTGGAQDSLCDPCVDSPEIRRELQRRFDEDIRFSSPSAVSIVRAEDMRRLGVIGVADMIALLPSDSQGIGPDSVPRGYATSHFDLRGDYRGIGVPIDELARQMDEIYAYVSERTGVSVSGLIPVTVSPVMPGACPARGRASTGEIELFAVGGGWSREQLLAVFAHELGHVLQFREIPAVGKLGRQFIQGYASWAAGRYWAGMQGQASLHAIVRDYLDRDLALPLDSDWTVDLQGDPAAVLNAACLARRDIVLTEWASLIEYLVESYGRDGFYARAAAAPESASTDVDYMTIFDRSFEVLEGDWLDAVRGGR